MIHKDALERAGLGSAELAEGTLVVRSPIDGAEIARTPETPVSDMPSVVARAKSAFAVWRDVPAPRRGELVRLFGEELRADQGGARRDSSRSRPERSFRRGSAKCRR